MHIFDGKNGKKAWFSRENEFADTGAKMREATANDLSSFCAKIRGKEPNPLHQVYGQGRQKCPFNRLDAGGIETNHLALTLDQTPRG